jgi:hypothetical protein
MGSWGTVTGKVRDLRERSGTNWFTKTEETIVSFRVSVFDDAGNLQRLVPVEVRGSLVTGVPNENDEVTVAGRFRRGVLRGNRIENHTDGSEVVAEGLPTYAKAFAAIFFAAVGAFMLFVFVRLVTGA